MQGALVPLAFFAILPIIVVAISYNRRKAHVAMGDVVKAIVDKGETPTPEIIAALGVRPRPKHADLRTGLILTAIGVATIFLGGAIPDKDAQSVFGGLAMFPILVGAVLVGLWAIIGRKTE